jgi:DUF1680 family protein
MITKNRFINLLFSSLFVIHTGMAQSVYPGQHKEKIKLPLNSEVKVYAFDLKDIRLLDSPFEQNMERNSEWIMSLDVNRLLHSFRTTSGVYAGLEGGYSTVKKLGGWESLDCELRGHSVGHIFLTCTLFSIPKNKS